MQERPQGYLPPDQPPLGALISLGFGILINLIFPPERYVPAARMAEMRASK